MLQQYHNQHKDNIQVFPRHCKLYQVVKVKEILVLLN